MKRNDIAIIGAGPAGISAALQLARYELRPFVYESGRPGGLLFDAGTIENYPGFPGGIEGPELAALFAAGLEDSGAVLCREEVASIDYAAGIFRIQAGSGADFSKVIIATGTVPVPLSGVEFDDPRTEDALDYGVSSIRTIAGRSVAVIGAGDAAFDYALTLSRRNDVVILQRGGRSRCNAALIRRVGGSERVTVLEGVTARRISMDESGRFVLSLGGGGCGSRDRMSSDHVVIAVGRAPREVEMLPGLAGGIGGLVEEGRLRFAGDVTNGLFRQTAIAAGDGVRAAMEIYEG
jgi:thioredoxin reductase (NADPH)